MDIVTTQISSTLVNGRTITAGGASSLSRVVSGERMTAQAGTECVGGVTFFQEWQLVPLADDGERADSSLVRQLLTAGSAAQRESIVRERLDDLGFDWMGYYTESTLSDGSRFCGFMTTYAALDWSRRYFSGGFHEFDPRNENRKRWGLPLVWDGASLADMLERRPKDTRSKRFVEELADTGMRSGVFQRVGGSGAKRGEDTVVSLVSSSPSRRWIDDGVLGSALTLILSLDHYWSHHVQLPAPATATDTSAGHLVASGLPSTQRAVLCHLAGGLTDREIAGRLGLSSYTVDYHLRQLRQRFRVHNRVQLVAAAAHLSVPA